MRHDPILDTGYSPLAAAVAVSAREITVASCVGHSSGLTLESLDRDA